MQNLLAKKDGSSIIISVSVTALVIAAALTVSIAIVSAARNSAVTSSANKAFFAAEAGIESAIYNLVDIDPGEEPTIATPEDWDSQFAVDIDNQITDPFTDPTIIEIPANDSVAISLYTSDDPADILDLGDIVLELSVNEAFTSSYRDLEPDLSINDIVNNNYIESNVDFLYPNLGRPLDAPTINLYNETGKSETWNKDTNDPIYQQVDDSVWCKIHLTNFADIQDGIDWWASLDPSTAPLCTTNFADLYATPINNIKTDSYPQDPGVLYNSDYSLYGPEAVFYLDNDENGVVSIANLTKLSVVSAEDTTAYERELAVTDYDQYNQYVLNSSPNDEKYISKNDGIIYLLGAIINSNPTLITKPILIVSTYSIPLNLRIGLTQQGIANGKFIPAIQTVVTSTGSKGQNSQKLEALIEHNNNIPVLNQTIVY